MFQRFMWNKKEFVQISLNCNYGKGSHDCDGEIGEADLYNPVYLGGS